MTRLRAVFSLLLLFASGPLLAASASHAAEAKRFVELTRVDKLAVPAYMQVRQMFAQRFAQAGGSEAQKAVLERYQAQADTALDKVVGEGKLDEALVALYTDAFSEAELKELLAFYQTPVGRKVLEQMPQLMAHSAQLTQARLQQALFGADWPTSLRANLQRLQWAAGSVRGKLSQANWQALVELQREAQALEGQPADFGELLDFLDRLLMSLAALSGFALDDMTRDDGWRFLMIGRCIERLQFLCESVAGLLRSHAAQDQSALEWLLELGNSIITYRTRYLAAPQLIPVLDLLLLDEQNPHAVLFQLRQLLRSLERLEEGFDFRAGPTLGELASKLAAFRLGSLESPLFGSSGQRAVLGGLADLLLQIAEVSGRVSDQLALRFFVHVDASQRTQSS